MPAMVLVRIPDAAMRIPDAPVRISAATPVVDVPAVTHTVNAERAPIAKAVSHDDPVRRLAAHERVAGERSIEVACRASVVP